MRVNSRYMVERNARYFFQPTPRMRALGFRAEALGNDKIEALARVERLTADWDVERRKRALDPEIRDMRWVLAQFCQSPKYKGWSEKHRLEFKRVAGEALKAFGAFRPRTVERRDVVDYYERQVAKGSLDKANRLIKALHRLFRYAYNRGEVKEVVTARMGLTLTPPREQIWAPGEVKALLEACTRPSIALAIRLAYDTAQREGDLLRLTWGQYDGATLRLRQGKTKRLVQVPLLPELIAGLDDTPRTGVQIIVSEQTKRPYRQFDFVKQFGKVKKAAKIAGKTFHDFRRSAITRLSDAGCTPQEIASISGHSIGAVMRILDTYSVTNTRQATAAIEKLRTKLEQR